MQLRESVRKTNSTHGIREMDGIHYTVPRAARAASCLLHHQKFILQKKDAVRVLRWLEKPLGTSPSQELWEFLADV